MKFINKSMLFACISFGVYVIVVADDGLTAYWNRLKSTVSQYLPAAQQPATGTATPIGEQPTEQLYVRPSIPSSPAATSAGTHVMEPAQAGGLMEQPQETPPRLSPELERFKQGLSTKAGLTALQTILPSQAAGALCERSVINELTDYIDLIKGYYTHYNDPQREIETKSQMQEAVLRLLLFKRLLLAKLPNAEVELFNLNREIDEWKNQMPFHKRHFMGEQGYRTQEEIFKQRRETPMSFGLPRVPKHMMRGTAGSAAKISLPSVPHTLTAEQFGGGLGEATAMGYVAGMTPEQEAELRERIPQISSSSEYYGYEPTPGSVVTEPIEQPVEAY